MSDISYQHKLTIQQAENEKEAGERLGNPELVKAAEKRIAAAKLAGAPPKDEQEDAG